MIKNTTRNQKLSWVLFILYLLALTYFLLFAESFGRTGNENSRYAYNLQLFKEIRRFYIYREQLGIQAMILNIVGNVVAFVPCGFFLPIVSRRAKHWYNTFLLGFLLSLGMEIIQLISKAGSFDVDDLLLNTIGAVLGFLMYRLVQNMRIRRRIREREKNKTGSKKNDRM